MTGALFFGRRAARCDKVQKFPLTLVHEGLAFRKHMPFERDREKVGCLDLRRRIAVLLNRGKHPSNTPAHHFNKTDPEKELRDQPVATDATPAQRSEEHTSELQSHFHL